MRGKTLTTIQKEKFIKRIKSTGGNVSKACQFIGISRSVVYDHRKNDPVFSNKWDEAVEYGIEQLEEEARRRAFRGTKRAKFYKGDVIGYEKEYSDTLLIFLLKGKKPETYRERFDIDQKVSGSLDVSILNKIDSTYGEDGE